MFRLIPANPSRRSRFATCSVTFKRYGRGCIKNPVQHNQEIRFFVFKIGFLVYVINLLSVTDGVALKTPSSTIKNILDSKIL
jgi:hypothetical protein